MKFSDFVGLNDSIVCAPFVRPGMATAGAAAPKANGRASSVSTAGGQGTHLVPLTVWAGDRDHLVAPQHHKGSAMIRPGDKVLVRVEDVLTQPWGRPVQVDGLPPFIVVPLRSCLTLIHDQAAFEAWVEPTLAPAQPTPDRVQLSE